MDARTEFEKWISKKPFSKSTERYPNDPKRVAWPGSYKDTATDLAWHAWITAWNYKEDHRPIVYKLKDNRRFSVKGWTFDCGKGQQVLLIKRDDDRKKVLLDFGGNLMDWFNQDILLDFDREG